MRCGCLDAELDGDIEEAAATADEDLGAEDLGVRGIFGSVG